MNPGRVIKTMLNFHYFVNLGSKPAKNGKFASLDRLRARNLENSIGLKAEAYLAGFEHVINLDKITCSLINQTAALSLTNLRHKYFKSNVRLPTKNTAV